MSVKGKKIILHCAATPDNKKSDHIDAKEIKRWHVEEFGWSDNGYHFIIKRDGTIEKGRPTSRAGAHVKGFNRGTLAICYVGTKKPTKAQWASIKALWESLEAQGATAFEVHNQYTPNKICPGFSQKHLLTTIGAKIPKDVDKKYY